MTIFGARREADVLWTDGFMEGGQLPTLNLANEFVDFDEDWYESIVGMAPPPYFRCWRRRVQRYGSHYL